MKKSNRRDFLKITSLSCMAIVSASTFSEAKDLVKPMNKYQFNPKYYELEALLKKRFPTITFTTPLLIELEQHMRSNNIAKRDMVFEFVKNSNYMLHKVDNSIKLEFQEYTKQIPM